MFTLDQINDIPVRLGKQTILLEYLLALKVIGVDKYDSFITAGHSEYFGKNNQKVVSPPVHKRLTNCQHKQLRRSTKKFKLA
jgi:hypothetical protein